MRPVKSLQVNNFLKKHQGCVCYQYDIYLDENRLVGPFQFRTTEGNKLKHPNTINDKKWKSSENERIKKEINTYDSIKVVPLRQ